MRAFQAAKRTGKGGGRAPPGLDGSNYVDRSEFRLLLAYLREYFELFLMFQARCDERRCVCSAPREPPAKGTTVRAVGDRWQGVGWGSHDLNRRVPGGDPGNETVRTGLNEYAWRVCAQAFARRAVLYEQFPMRFPTIA